MGWNKARKSGLNALPLVKSRTKTTFTTAPGSIWLSLKHSTSQGTAASISAATGSQGTGPRCFLLFIALGGKGKSIQTQSPQHRGDFKGLAAKLESTAPLEQGAAGNPGPAGDFKTCLHILLEEKPP